MVSYRITALKEYLLEEVLQELDDTILKLNINFLSNNVDDYSLVKLPVEEVNKWITGEEIRKEQYNLVSRRTYSQTISNNIENLGFFELVAEKIRENNQNDILPDIDGIEKIECLNCGSLIDRDTNTAVFSIQLQITYRKG